MELVGDHDPSGGYKGGKYSAYEAGTRVPTIVYWQGKIQPMISDALVTQIDLLASLASLTGAHVGDGVVDSENYLQAWFGQDKNGRDELLEESFTLSLRSGEWKYIKPFEGQTPDWLANKDIAVGLSSTPQLYNLNSDKEEEVNLVSKQQDLVNEMENTMNKIIQKK